MLSWKHGVWIKSKERDFITDSVPDQPQCILGQRQAIGDRVDIDDGTYTGVHGFGAARSLEAYNYTSKFS